jgi:hypothetical protein
LSLISMRLFTALDLADDGVLAQRPEQVGKHLLRRHLVALPQLHEQLGLVLSTAVPMRFVVDLAIS